MQLSVYGIGILVLASFLVSSPGLCQRNQTHNDTTLTESPAGVSLERTVRQNLARSEEDRDAIRELFIIGNEAIPSLVKFLHSSNGEVRVKAARGLAYIGNEHGMKALRAAVASEHDNETKSNLAYFLTGGLVQAVSPSDQEYLRRSIERAAAVNDPALSDYAAAPAVNAALALAITGEDDVLPALRQFEQLGLTDSDEIAKAIRWIENKPGTEPTVIEAAANEKEIVQKIVLTQTFFAEKSGDETGVDALTFDPAGTRVLVSIGISGNGYSRGYDLVLAKSSETWKITGVWFTWIT